MPTTELARAGAPGYDAIQAILPATSQQLTVDADAEFVWIAIGGAAPVSASGNARFTLMPDISEVFAISPQGKVSVTTDTTPLTVLSAAVAAGITAVRLTYKRTSGIVEVAEAVAI